MTRCSFTLSLGLALGVLTLVFGCEAERRADMVPITSRGVVRRNNIAVDIANVAGSVTLVVRPGCLPEVKVQPVNGPSGKGGVRTKHGSATGVEVDGKATLRVVGGAEPSNVWVSVPSCDWVRVRNSDGPVTLQGVCGEVDVQNDSTNVLSPVRIYAGPGVLGSVTVRSGRGDVELRAPRGSAASLVSKTPIAATDLRPGESSVQRVRIENGMLEATLNGGGPTWTLEAARGRCVIDMGQHPQPAVELAELWPF
ncbi:MAG: hypothetical protein ACOYN0_01410 [Phycisphaerales bacterium]